MLTARRLHEQRAREAAGLPEPPPRAPDSIPYHEHQTALRELGKAHAQELSALRAELARLQAAPGTKTSKPRQVEQPVSAVDPEASDDSRSRAPEPQGSKRGRS
jgi:hypothetical protein